MSDNDQLGAPPPNDNPPPPSAPPAGSDDNMQGMLCWLLGIFIGFISPLIFMITGKERPKVYANAMQCLTFHLMMVVLWIIVIIISIVTCGIGAILYLVPWAISLIFSILGTIEANKGNVYEPPVTGQLAKQWFKV